MNRPNCFQQSQLDAVIDPNASINNTATERGLFLFAFFLYGLCLSGNMQAASDPAGLPFDASFSLGLSNALFGALTVGLFFRFALKLHNRPRQAFFAALMLAACTPLWDGAKTYLFAPSLTFALLLCVYFLHRFAQTARSKLLWLCGACLGYCLVLRPELAVLLPLFAVYLFLSGGRTKAVLVFSTLPMAFLLLAAAVHISGALPALSEGAYRPAASIASLITGIPALLTSPMQGLLFYAPVVVIGAFGLPRFWKHDRALAWLVPALFAVLLVMYANDSAARAVLDVGPRMLLPVLPLLLLPAVPMLDLKKRGGYLGALFLLLCAAGLSITFLCTVGDRAMLQARHLSFFGEAGQLDAPARFLHFAPAEFLRQLHQGRINIAWFNLQDLGASALWLVFPILCLGGLALSLWMLRSAIPRRPERPTATPPQRRLVVTLALVSLLLFGTVAAERLTYKRGLALHLYSDVEASGASAKTLRGREVLVDAFDNPLDAIAPRAKMAVWEGVLYIPSEYFSNHYHLLATGQAGFFLDGKQRIAVTQGQSGDAQLVTENNRVKKGYHPIRVTFTPNGDSPYLNLRWTLQDFAFMTPIPRKFLFTKTPGAVGRAIIEGEFYLLLCAVIALYLALAIALENRAGRSVFVLSTGAEGAKTPPSD